MKGMMVIVAVSFFVVGVASVSSGERPCQKSLTNATTAETEICPEETPLPDKEKKTVSKRLRLKQVTGRITAVDREEKSIAVGGVTIMVDEKKLGNLKEGDKIKVDYYSKGVNRAVIIQREFDDAGSK